MKEAVDPSVQMHCVCKLKHDIRVESKIELAKREIEHVLGTTVETVVTLPGLFRKPPFSLLDDKVIDRMTRLLYLGKAHGFRTELSNLGRLLKLSRNATYLREIYALGIIQKDQTFDITRSLGLPDSLGARIRETDGYIRILPNAQIYNRALSSDQLLTGVFFVPIQTILEYAGEAVKLPYVTFTKQYKELGEKLGRMETGLKKGIADLVEHLASSPKRMPWLGLYKENIGDYIDWGFTDFRSWGLHFIHKHEGKADPWLARSALNFLAVQDGGRALDPFCGSGTFLADAPLLNIAAVGVDINPLSTLITRVKCELAQIPLAELRESIIRVYDCASGNYHSKDELDTLIHELRDCHQMKTGNVESALSGILSLRDAIRADPAGSLVKDFLNTILSRLIIELNQKRRIRNRAVDGFLEDAIGFYLQTYASQEVLHLLNLDVRSTCDVHTGDVRNIRSFLDGKVDGIITSPPYFDALDYVGFSDLPIRILGLAKDRRRLDTETIGSKSRIASDVDLLSLAGLLPESSNLLVNGLLKAGRERKARTVLQYVVDMSDCLQTLSEILKDGGRIIFVVGKYHHWRIGDRNVQVDGAQVLIDLGEHAGLTLVEELPHSISKIEAGRRIKEESVIIWQKGSLGSKSNRDADRSRNVLRIEDDQP